MDYNYNIIYIDVGFLLLTRKFSIDINNRIIIIAKGVINLKYKFEY